MDIREFIAARLQEDELWALSASADRDRTTTVAGGVHWTWAVGDNWDPVQADPLEPYMGGYDGQWSNPVVLRTVEEWYTGYGPPSNTLPEKIAESEELRTADGAHIARHDPARVLRDIEATRGLLALHAAADFPYNPDDGPGDYSWTARCASCHAEDPCPTLRLLALPHREHPDYDPAWSPS